MNFFVKCPCIRCVVYWKKIWKHFIIKSVWKVWSWLENLESFKLYQFLMERKLYYGCNTVKALWADTLISGQLYLQPLWQNPIWTLAHTNSVFTHSRNRPASVAETFPASRECLLIGAFTVIRSKLMIAKLVPNLFLNFVFIFSAVVHGTELGRIQHEMESLATWV